MKIRVTHVLASTVLFLAIAAQSASLEFTAETCKDLSTITHEVLELELSGARWQGGVSPCLQQNQFKTIYAVQEKILDSSLLDPEYLLPKGREIRVLSEKWLDIGAVEVRFAYIAQKNGKEAPVQDQLVYKLNYGKNRQARGCAVISEEPRYFVMRKGCSKE
jgi:hypothetical protein